MRQQKSYRKHRFNDDDYSLLFIGSDGMLAANSIGDVIIYVISFPIDESFISTSSKKASMDIINDNSIKIIEK